MNISSAQYFPITHFLPFYIILILYYGKCVYCVCVCGGVGFRLNNQDFQKTKILNCLKPVVGWLGRNDQLFSKASIPKEPGHTASLLPGSQLAGVQDGYPPPNKIVWNKTEASSLMRWLHCLEAILIRFTEKLGKRGKVWFLTIKMLSLNVQIPSLHPGSTPPLLHIEAKNNFWGLYFSV